MLALLTGIPGYGKTAHAIDWVFFQESDFTGLDRYVEGVSQLDNVKCPHYLMPSLSELRSPDFVPLTTVDAEDEDAQKYKPWLPGHPDYAEHQNVLRTAKHPLELWYLWAQKGSVLLVDEAQRFYRPRPSGAKVPLFVSMLEYHRHFGIHFLLISQAPRLMDLHVRALVEKHVHLTKTWKGGIKYEWPQCRDIDSKADKIEAAKSAYSPPKHVFPLYQSSSLHLKVKHKIPKIVFLVAGAVLFFVLAAAGAVWKIRQDKFKKNEKPSVGAASGVPAVGSLDSASGVAGAPLEFSAAASDRYISQFKPVVPALPESAHAYDQIRKVSVMPRISGCASMGDKCRCYTQQGTYLPEIPLTRCVQLSVDGFGFDPYQGAEAPKKEATTSTPVQPRVAAVSPSVSVPADEQARESVNDRLPIGQTPPDVPNPAL